MQGANRRGVCHPPPGEAEEVVGRLPVPVGVAGHVPLGGHGALIVRPRNCVLRQRFEVYRTVILEIAIVERRVLEERIGWAEVGALQDYVVGGRGYGGTSDEVASLPVRGLVPTPTRFGS